MKAVVGIGCFRPIAVIHIANGMTHVHSVTDATSDPLFQSSRLTSASKHSRHAMCREIAILAFEIQQGLRSSSLLQI